MNLRVGIQLKSNKQTVWRSISKSGNQGWVVWDVTEVLGEPIKELLDNDYFTLCADGSYISAQAFHFWTKERAWKCFTENAYPQFQTLYKISGNPELTNAEYRKWFAIED
jgi:hypothetical protein